MRSLAFAVLASFLLVGMVASIRGGFRVSLLVVFQPVGSPRFKSRGCRATWLLEPALAIASYCLRHLQDVQLPLSLLFITPFASLVFLENFAVGCVDGVFGSGSEQLTPLGCSSCSVSIFCLVSFYPSG